MTDKYTKWTACWGNASSIHEQTEARYSKDLTLRYPLFMPFGGKALRFHFSNLTGTDAIMIKACVSYSDGTRTIDTESTKQITYHGNTDMTVEPGKEICSDPIGFDVKAGTWITVSMYLKDFTDMNTAVKVSGPLSKGYYAYGDQMTNADLEETTCNATDWFYFLNTVDILTEEKNHALICYGDSITAQSWPDYLIQRAWENGYHDISIIRRAISGSRIMRQYDNITYAAYGRKGKERFELETNTAGADAVLIQHGINDIIHPVGTDVNLFRPWSDLPTAEELEQAFTDLYIGPAKEKGLKVWGGTLTAIEGWRTYEPFRNDLRNEFNDWLRSTPLLDGCVDFDAAIRDPDHIPALKEIYDSGDHLHPSEEGYRAMANAIPEELLK